ncbi:MAG: MBL fold metallo-hydrolase [Chitinophagaceae bacterium]|nr:MBL fold metallo-hydrolase [Chitinophagaceae bacterium]
MKIGFHGAARTVTGSKHLLTLSNGKKYLLDCGMYQGLGKDTDVLNRDFGFDPAKIDYVILSHAHVDHCGLLPKLVKDGYPGKIFCTPPTKELATVLMEDSANIQENDLRFLNKTRSAQGKSFLQPLYDVNDARNASDRFVEVDYGKWVSIDENVKLMYLDAGHIIGSTTVHLQITENGKITNLTFSGDVGRYRDVILKSPAEFPQSDYIIMESTYGNKLHDRVTGTSEALLKWITETCIEKKGKLILPAFSVGRTQELLYALNTLELENSLPDLPYYVDSPLSLEATGIMKNYPQYFNNRIQKVMQSDNDPFQFKGLRFVKTVDESKSLNYRNEPMVIISASGMAEAGRVKHHISNNIENSRNAIVLTGYCEPNSLGGRLKLHPKEVGIFGFVHQVNATIGEIKSMSAHGDYEDLSQWLACQDPKQVKKLFLVHGEYDVQLDFQNRLISKGFSDVEVPALHSEIGLG